MKKYKIIPTEQGWLDHFNSQFLSSYQWGEIISLNDYETLSDKIEFFNEIVAGGPAIVLLEVEE